MESRVAHTSTGERLPGDWNVALQYSRIYTLYNTTATLGSSICYSPSLVHVIDRARNRTKSTEFRRNYNDEGERDENIKSFFLTFNQTEAKLHGQRIRKINYRVTDYSILTFAESLINKRDNLKRPTRGQKRATQKVKFELSENCSDRKPRIGRNTTAVVHCQGQLFHYIRAASVLKDTINILLSADLSTCIFQ